MALSSSMAKIKTGKITQEFQKLDLGDARLNSRALEVVCELNSLPRECINAAVEDWSSKKAVYRFFDNDKTTSDKILATHYLNTQKRMGKYKYVLSLQDTSFLDFNKHKKTQGLGSIGRYPNREDHVQGLVFHASFAIGDNGLPLGLQSFEIWARPKDGYGGLERENKESQKWLNHLKKAKALYDEQTKMILVTDREGDYFDLFDCIKKENIDGVIRSKHDRNIKGKDICLGDRLSKTTSCGMLVLHGIKTKKNTMRSAKLEIKFSKIQIEVPGSCQRRYPFGLEINVVEAKEVDPPSEDEGLYWRLLTTLPVENYNNAVEIVSIYKKRWNIESFFKVLKSGCKIEDCRLETAERLSKYIAVMSVVAWRIYWMVHVNRTNPIENWSFVLTKIEYYTLWVRTNKAKIMEGKLPKKPPSDQEWTVHDCIRSVAKLGGFNGRASDGEPGMISIWRGWMRLQDMVEIAEALI